MSAFYCNTIHKFLSEDPDAILGKITSGGGKPGFQQLEYSQVRSWESFICLLKSNFAFFKYIGLDSAECGILLEYPIPRREKRIDCVLLLDDLIVVIEYKDNESAYHLADKVQVEDYCLDLRDFHAESSGHNIVPILLASSAKNSTNLFSESSDSVKEIVLCNAQSLTDILIRSYKNYSTKGKNISLRAWNESQYSPTPTIIEAAQSLYSGKSVREISRSQAGAENLTKTSEIIISIMKDAQLNHSRVICFITGVPGAGKTLAGLNIVHEKTFSESGKEIGVFLSGNGPLVRVLREALARDFKRRNKKVKKGEALRRVKTFIQNVHDFVKTYFIDKTTKPIEHVVIFDEAQRAWNAKKLNAWNARNAKGEYVRDVSEAEMLINIMDRHVDWAVIVALVGGGQEIHDGEAGLPEWGRTLYSKYPHWKIYISNELLEGDHSTGNLKLFTSIPEGLNIYKKKELHLDVAIRSYRAKHLSEFVSLLLENKPLEAKSILIKELNNYPLYITRSLNDTRKWLRDKQRGSRRTGLVASSGGRRLRAFGLDVKAELEVEEWFLNPIDDMRSSFSLEVPATEFGIQGLELDWVGLCWDADLRRKSNNWEYKNFIGPKWNNVLQKEKQHFIINKYRVLMTRAREGMIIWVPLGDIEDETRDPKFYNDIYDYLKSCGIPDL